MRTHSQFLRDLGASYGPVFDVACWLKGLGYDPLITPPQTRLRENYKQFDQGDIVISQRIEVKCRDLDFTCAEDYRFPTVFVDVKENLADEYLRMVWAYVIVNKQQTHAALLRTSDRDKWIEFRGHDNRANLPRTWLTCPKEYAWFGRIAPDDQMELEFQCDLEAGRTGTNGKSLTP
jgi:hypothetical protein